MLHLEARWLNTWPMTIWAMSAHSDKLRRFAYQSECRLVCYDGPGGPREVRIGSLEDISIMMPSEDVNRRIKLGQDAFEVLIDDL